MSERETKRVIRPPGFLTAVGTLAAAIGTVELVGTIALLLEEGPSAGVLWTGVRTAVMLGLGLQLLYSRWCHRIVLRPDCITVEWRSKSTSFATEELVTLRRDRLGRAGFIIKGRHEPIPTPFYHPNLPGLIRSQLRDWQVAPAR